VGPAVREAPRLLGRVLARRFAGDRIARARIVEVEAYEPDDPASHSFRGLTGRNAVMFGDPGHLYVYLIYGVHSCMNVVTGPEGTGSAVLLRAGEPLDGLDAMRVRRPRGRDRDLCRGPGRFAQAFGVDRSLDGVDLFDEEGEIWIEPGRPLAPARIAVSTRVGIRRGADRPWRFYERGSPFVSRGPAASPSAASRP
jgi:DNA-3-methyladenine glycosylase